MKIEVFEESESVAREAAVLIAADARVAVAERGRFVLAVSGGHTPWVMLRARRILWLVTGSEKVGMLVRMRDGDPSIPAGRVCQDRGLVFADRPAAGQTA
jgi:6-phosphogluconolactonase/glucosamine-6-phosphate isomerase/deaminase